MATTRKHCKSKRQMAQKKKLFTAQEKRCLFLYFIKRYQFYEGKNMTRKVGKEYEQIFHQENKNGKNYLKKNTSLY